MLAPIKHLLPTKRIILASQSIRRRQIFELIDLSAEVMPPKLREKLDPNNFKRFEDFVQTAALKKVEQVYSGLKIVEDNEPVVIGAETLVTMDNKITGVPKNPAEAVRMLESLSGKRNRVYTGVVLKHPKGTHSFAEIADVHFGNLNQQQIKDYVDSGDPLNKPGGYDLVGPGGALIQRIEGDFYCVVGLPLHRFCCQLNEIILRED